MKNYPLNNNSAKLLGRVVFYGEKLWLTHSASGCEFEFTGKKLVLDIGCDENSLNDKRCNHPRIAVLVDGRTVIKKVIDSSSEVYTLCESDSPASHIVRIVKLSEGAFSLACVSAETDDEASIVPTAPKKLSIEFIGDSITCGYGVDDSNIESDFACEAENAMKSYAYITAQMLDADYSLFSYSGYGIISGYSADGIRNIREVLPPWYESTCFSYSTMNGQKIQEIPWDFSKAPVDIVVVNLGTNDTNFCEMRRAYIEFEDSYHDFIKKVRANNPDSLIICALGIMEERPLPHIEKAVKRLKDDNVKVFRFSRQNGWLGYGSNWHPSEETQRYAAEELAGFIKELIS